MSQHFDVSAVKPTPEKLVIFGFVPSAKTMGPAKVEHKIPPPNGHVLVLRDTKESQLLIPAVFLERFFFLFQRYSFLEIWRSKIRLIGFWRYKGVLVSYLLMLRTAGNAPGHKTVVVVGGFVIAVGAVAIVAIAFPLVCFVFFFLLERLPFSAADHNIELHLSPSLLFQGAPDMFQHAKPVVSICSSNGTGIKLPFCIGSEWLEKIRVNYQKRWLIQQF